MTGSGGAAVAGSGSRAPAPPTESACSARQVTGYPDTATGGRASRQRNRLEIEYRPDFGVEYLMGQFFAHLQRLFRRMEDVCAGITSEASVRAPVAVHHARRRVAYRGGRLIGSRPSPTG